MSKNLVIVESPAKAKTIEKFLGSDYTVKSSFGHIRDLPKKGLGVDVDNGYTPDYELSADKKKVISELKRAAKDSQVWLASDEDREGEAIAWHLCHALGIAPETTRRIVFHEITKPAITAAIKNPRTVNQALVDAQQARRILDRLVGYKLSPVLWKKIRPGLSAGRVQSVAVRLIVEREREITAYTPKDTYKVTATFANAQTDDDINAELRTKLGSKEEASELLSALKDAKFRIKSVEQRPGKKSPPAPFTTSSLQQEAARRLGFSVKQTMSVAQRLYENGHITYMRTDSTILSDTALRDITLHIKSEFGERYHHQRQYSTKTRSAQEAHEAIRPTRAHANDAGADEQQKKLYSLIWRRTIASQMASAEIDRTDMLIASSNRDELFVAKGEVLRFDGYIRVYGGGKDDALLPELSTGDELTYKEMVAQQTFSRPPARYSEASLVKKLEELGIGRPSTYAPTISTVQARGYVEKADLEGEERTSVKITLTPTSGIHQTEEHQIYGADKSKLLPTSTALVTTDFLVKNFPAIVDYDFTAKAEEDFDKIAQEKLNWVQVIDKFYQDLLPQIEKSESISRHESTQARQLGTDPSTKLPIYARFGRYGMMLQKGSAESDDKPAFAPMPDGRTVETVTLDEALEMFKLPRLVGQTADGHDINANIGRFGPYIQVGKTYVSIKPLDPMEITLDEAREKFETKKEQDKNKYISEFDNGTKVVNGPYGPYVTDGKKNARIPKDVKPESITAEKAAEMIAKAPARKKRYAKRRKKA
jgi:DNA topoisomerase I